MGKSIHITVTPEQRQDLMALRTRGTTEKRVWQRTEIILRSEAGETAVSIARLLGIQAHIVTKWRHRFAELGVDGLRDMPRAGAPRKIDGRLEERVLAVLDEAPPRAYSRWNGRLVAERLGDVTAAQVWTVMRRHGIDLERRRSWCVSTDPEFAAKAADIVGLYLNPPENAVVLCMDEKPCIQAVERTQGYLRFSDRRTMLGFSDRYARHGCTTLFAALEVATGGDHPQPARTEAPQGIPGLHERAGRRLPEPGAARGAGQPQHAPQEGRAMAGLPSPRAFPLHADQRLLAQPGRGVLQHPAAGGPGGRELHVGASPAGSHQTVHQSLQRKRPAVRMEEDLRGSKGAAKILLKLI